MSNFPLLDLVRRDPIRDWWELELLGNARTYENFIECIDRCIDSISTRMADTNQHRTKDSEDRTTVEIRDQLDQTGLFDTVEHDAQVGGHVDLLVRLGSYKWKAEAKIFGGRHSYDDSWLKEGFLALTEKYTKGLLNDSHGCLLIYVKKPNINRIMEDWSDYLVENTDANIDFSPCCLNPLARKSIHEHIVSGLPYTVRHVPVCLYDPTKSLKNH